MRVYQKLEKNLHIYGSWQVSILIVITYQTVMSRLQLRGDCLHNQMNTSKPCLVITCYNGISSVLLRAENNGASWDLLLTIRTFHGFQLMLCVDLED